MPRVTSIGMRFLCLVTGAAAASACTTFFFQSLYIRQRAACAGHGEPRAVCGVQRRQRGHKGAARQGSRGEAADGGAHAAGGQRGRRPGGRRQGAPTPGRCAPKLPPECAARAHALFFIHRRKSVPDAYVSGSACPQADGLVQGAAKPVAASAGQGSLATYRELCALSTSLGKPQLLYALIDVAAEATPSAARRGAALGLHAESTDASRALLQPHVAALLPLLYRASYDALPIPSLNPYYPCAFAKRVFLAFPRSWWCRFR